MNESTKYYVAYGSNLNVPQMGVRCPSATMCFKGELEDYQLAFRGNKYASYLTIEPCEGKSVPVVIWKVTPQDERSLDTYEGYPRAYGKMNIDLGNNMVGFTYVMNPRFRISPPTKYYLKTCLEGYEYFGFDKQILLSALPEGSNHLLDNNAKK